MADVKISDLTNDASPTADDLIETENDPGGTPAARKVTLGNLRLFFHGSPAFTGTVTLPTGLTGVIRADSGVVSVDSDVTDIVAAASDTAAGKVELATTAEAVTGTDTVRAVTPAGAKAVTDALVAGGTAISSLGPAAGNPDSDDGIVGVEDGTPVQFSGAQVVNATAVNASGAVMESDYDANTVLAATVDNTPAALTMGASTILARLAAGNIIAATPAQLKTLLAITGADVANTPTGTIAATTAQAAIDELATDKFEKSFGTTTQSIANGTGRHFDYVNDNTFAANDIYLRLFLNNTDTAACFQVGTVAGVVVAFTLGGGGSTAPETTIGRLRAYVPSTNLTSAVSSKTLRVKLLNNVTAVGNVTTGDDDLQTASIPASLMTTNGDMVVFEAYGTFANNANAKTLRVKYGGTTVVTVTLPTSVAGHWRACLWVTRTGAATQDCYAEVTYNGATQGGFSTAAETLTGAVTAKCTGDATSTNDVVSEIAHTYWEPSV